jgi:acetyltransferase-like isoleucine patch superfamily enzyme
MLHALTVRVLQVLALYAPGAWSVRVWLHRRRGVHIGRDVFIGTDTLIETEHPERVWIGNGVTLSARCTIIAHFRGARSGVRIEDDVFVGPGAIILPGVTVHRGAVVSAGSVVTSAVAQMTLVQGNPARAVARCGIPLSSRTPAAEFYRRLKPLRAADASASSR